MVAAVFLTLFVRGRDWGSIWTRVQEADPGWLALALGTQVLLYGVKVLRWGRLFPGTRPSFASRWHATLLGFAANLVLPGRLGEPLRVGAIHRLGRVDVSHGVSSVVLERILDLAALGCLLGLGALSLGSGNASLVTMQRIGLAVALVTLLMPPGLYLVLGGLGDQPPSWMERLLGFLPAGLRESARGFLLGLGRGFSVVDGLAPLALVFLLSLVHWVIGVLGIWAVARALGLGLSLAGGAVVLGAVAFAVALPQAPGYVGTYHWATAETLALLGQPTEQAAACAVLFWLVGVLPTLLMGLVSLLLVGRQETREMLG